MRLDVSLVPLSTAALRLAVTASPYREGSR
jgi:hypothetical protein